MARNGPGPTVLSAFTGACGLDLGLEAAGFQTVGCVELDADASATVRANRPHWPMLEPSDIRLLAPGLRPETLGLKPGQLGALAAGPPCQPFSKAAQWSATGTLGLADQRGQCIGAFLEILRWFLPRVLLIENVPGFARGRTNVAPLIQEALTQVNAEAGTQYHLQMRIVNAADYGVPQCRRRVIMVALRDGAEFLWPKPVYAACPARAWDAIGDIREADPPKATGRWAGLLPSIPEGHNYLWHTERGGGRPLFGYRTRFWSFLLKLAKDRPAWTIPAQPGPATGPFHWDNRPLSAKEALRLQSFPASWRVAGSHRCQLRQIGNATPPLLTEVIGRQLGQQVFGMEYAGRPTLSIPRKRSVPPPEEATAVPGVFCRLEGDHAPHAGPGKGPRPVKRSESDNGQHEREFRPNAGQGQPTRL